MAHCWSLKKKAKLAIDVLVSVVVRSLYQHDAFTVQYF